MIEGSTVHTDQHTISGHTLRQQDVKPKKKGKNKTKQKQNKKQKKRKKDEKDEKLATTYYYYL